VRPIRMGEGAGERGKKRLFGSHHWFSKVWGRENGEEPSFCAYRDVDLHPRREDCKPEEGGEKRREKGGHLGGDCTCLKGEWRKDERGKRGEEAESCPSFINL